MIIECFIKPVFFTFKNLIIITNGGFMKRYGILGAALCLAAGVTGCSGEDAASLTANPFPPLPPANTTYFDVTDEAGHWFDTREKIAGTNSLAVVKPNRKIKFLQTRSFNGPSRVESLHTVTRFGQPVRRPMSGSIKQPQTRMTMR